jgi:hypothetical protein
VAIRFLLRAIGEFVESAAKPLYLQAPGRPIGRVSGRQPDSSLRATRELCSTTNQRRSRVAYMAWSLRVRGSPRLVSPEGTGRHAQGAHGAQAPGVRGFRLQISYDKLNRRIEISATITEAVAGALQNEQDLPEEVLTSLEGT